MAFTRLRLKALLSTCLFYASSSLAISGTLLGGNGLSGGLRWDAEIRTVLGLERSLVGGIRYSVEGRSYTAYRDLFVWAGAAPTDSDFTQAVKQAFSAWESVDPDTGLGTDIYFVEDFLTPIDTSSGFGGGRIRGAEIDLAGRNGGVDGLGGFTTFFDSVAPVTLTSGTPDYAVTRALAGVDVHMNTAHTWTLDRFRRTLTHEIGHAIGLGDVETDIDPEFIDDNYDGTTSATALATLTNSWAALVDPFDPAASPLSVFTVANSDPGIDTIGVDLLMESNTTGIGPNNPLSNLIPLTADEYSMRQFLYPYVVSEPMSLKLLLIALGLCYGLGRYATDQSNRALQS